MSLVEKSSVDEIRARFDQDVERFSNLSIGQTATIDSAECLDLVAAAAQAATPGLRDVLDVGCGAGNYALKLREYVPSARFTLVDLSEPMVNRAHERLGSSTTAILQKDLRALKLPSESFDVILAAAVLHHLRTPAEWEQTFRDFFRWLRPSGSVWIFDLVAHENKNIQSLQWVRYGRYLERLGGIPYRDKVFAYVEREDTPTTLTYQLELLRSVGFSQLDVLHKNACFAAYGAVKANS